MADSGTRTRSGVSVRWLLLGVNGLVVLVPLLAVLGLKLYQNHLIAQTEISLIGQAVVIGESWRSHYIEELGEAPDSRDRAALMPPVARDQRFAPIEPVIDLSDGVPPPWRDRLGRPYHGRVRRSRANTGRSRGSA